MQQRKGEEKWGVKIFIEPLVLDLVGLDNGWAHKELTNEHISQRHVDK